MSARLSSTAVMGRRLSSRQSVDDFPTPPWATRALVEHLRDKHNVEPTARVWEPSCNRGYMVRALEEYFTKVDASDVVSYGDHELHDFVGVCPDPVDADWVITNPPFTLGIEFALRALREPNRRCALLLRTAFLEGQRRYDELFSKVPPNEVLVFAERVAMVQGRYDPAASSATSYSWFIWERHIPLYPRVRWIPPGTRRRLESRMGEARQC